MPKDVVLTTGKTVRVYAPPITRIFTMLDKKYPPVPPKIAESETVTGGVIRMIIEDDPEYLAAVVERENKILADSQELQVLFALKDEVAPEDWDVGEVMEIIQFSNPDWSPREGKLGRKLDWLEWELLSNPADVATIQATIMELCEVDMEAVAATEATFQGTVERETA